MTKLKKIIRFITNPKLLLCLVLAWLITNGWAYITLAISTYFKIKWLMALSSGYLTFLWVPISPEKIVTVCIAMLLLRLLFPNDEKTLAVIKEMYAKDKFMKQYSQKKRRIIIWATSIVVLLAVIIGICAVYVNDYYKADAEAIAAFAPSDTITKEVLDDNTIIYAPENATTGFIFYPGGKVEYTAYEPLMRECADRGVLCALVEMPFNLAVLDVNAADGIQKMYPEIENWYIGGHSLGGSMAASYLSKHTESFDGLVLLGSYSTADLSDTELDVLSIYGSEDKVLNRVKYDENKSNLPDDFTEVVIDGGCHAYFGMYGAQDGDGTPTITNKEQITLTVDEILRFTNDTV